MIELKIKQSDLHEISNEDSARIEMRQRWFNFAEWDRHNPIKQSLPKSGETIGKFFTLDDLRARIMREMTATADDIMVVRRGVRMHPARIQFVARAHNAGAGVKRMAEYLKVTKPAVARIVQIGNRMTLKQRETGEV